MTPLKVLTIRLTHAPSIPSPRFSVSRMLEPKPPGSRPAGRAPEALQRERSATCLRIDLPRIEEAVRTQFAARSHGAHPRRGARRNGAP